jgi:beta-glucosidase
MSNVAALAMRFPAGFLFGAATAAYQIEGGHDADDRGLSIWDTFTRRPGAVTTGETGDIACDHYHRWSEDIAIMRELGLDAYRFSISWPRVLPSGTGTVNNAGIEFYDRLVDALLAAGIRPFVTLYHWDLPQALQDQGGWTSRNVVPAFGDYADLVARRLGDRVTNWITLNEPQAVAHFGHYLGVHAPGLRDFPTAVLVSHHLLLAHRAAADAIHAARPSARVGIALNLQHIDPDTDQPEDVEAARRWDGYQNRWFLDPLFDRGYPRDLVEFHEAYFDRANEMDGYSGRLDFLGVNNYTRHIVRYADGPLRLEWVEREGVERAAFGKEVHPASFHKLLGRLHKDYSPREIMVTENGAAYYDVLADNVVDDPLRVSFLSRHFAAAAEAIGSGVPLTGYFVWALMDSFEWDHGTTKRYGLVHVDHRTQRRRIKSSGRWYGELIAAKRRAVAAP